MTGMTDRDRTPDPDRDRAIVAACAAVVYHRWDPAVAAAAEVATKGNRIDAAKLGYAMRKYRGRVAGGFRLAEQMANRSVKRWRAERVRGGGDVGDVGDVSPHSTREAVVSHTLCDTTRTHRLRADGCPTSPTSPPAAIREEGPRPCPCPGCSGTLRRLPDTPEVSGFVNLDCDSCGHVAPVEVAS